MEISEKEKEENLRELLKTGKIGKEILCEYCGEMQKETGMIFRDSSGLRFCRHKEGDVLINYP